jgi:S-DNA-T family DNA segregation ATPase FtsK/SpoIIIE
MHTLRRHESPLERLSDAILAFARRRCAEGVGLALFGFAAALSLSLITWSVKDPSLNYATGGAVRNLLGTPGAIVSDLLIQIFGLGAVAVALVPAIWGIRLMREGAMRRTAMRLALWAAGTWALAAFVSAMPSTRAWPLPTGLGGLAGDALLGAARTIGGGLGVFVAGLVFAGIAVFALIGACGIRRVRTDPFVEPEKPAASRRERDVEEPSRDDEPSLAIIWLGGIAHGLMSARAAFQRRLEAKQAASAPLRSVGQLDIDPRLDRLDRLDRFDRPAPPPSRTIAVPQPSIPMPVPAAVPTMAPIPVPAAAASKREIVYTPPLRGPASRLGQPASVFDGPAPVDLDEVAARGRVQMPEPEYEEIAEEDREELYDEPAFETPDARAYEEEDDPLPPPAPAGRVPSRASVQAPGRVAPAPRAAEAPRGRVFDPASYALPPLPLLAEPKKQVATVSKDALEQNATLLESTLEDFGVRGEIINVRPGPVVTLYELEPAPGTKSSRVIGLADDIARSMSAVSARVAVVPGRNAIGIELPNQKRETVFLRELLASEDFAGTKQKLALCLGKNIGGEPIIADLARMPHLLVAGTTGSGKSVAINTMILSLLYMHKPEQCRLIMVDPKMLELSVYDGIPHLLTPVVTDPKKAVIALKWAVREMEERYKKMSKLSVRNIDGFNQRVEEAKARGEVITRTVQTGFDRNTGEAIYEDEIMDLEPLPYIVVIVDEMADLMMVAGKDIEGAIQRLAQMARAAGIHLIMATQRPSVDVITGTIKANFPTRISFQVTSKIDSRTILGEMGAEQLLGQGDMLYMAGGGRITRVHGPFVSDGEVEKVVAHLKAQGRPQYLDAITKDDEDLGGAEDGAVFDKGAMAAFGDESQDPYDQAIAVVMRDRKASTSYIQRRLGIGYNRAASIMERMEKEGIVGPANHAGKREILMEVGAGQEDDE